VRLALDVLLAFTANPEDFTARGKIITPLKDRIGSEITTHYPVTVDIGMAITKQEAWTVRDGVPLTVSPLVAEVVERVAFEARDDKRVDKRSGVSQRMPITLLENISSNAERRAMTHGEDVAAPRISDLYAALTAITGKLELEYEGELVGPTIIARELIRRAADSAFREHAGEPNTDSIVIYFDAGGALQIADDAPSATVEAGFAAVPGLIDLVHEYGLADRHDRSATVAACEVVLEALVARRKISRSDGGTYGRAMEQPRRRRPRGDDQISEL
jgi:magnesium chelatase subunit I